VFVLFSVNTGLTTGWSPSKEPQQIQIRSLWICDVSTLLTWTLLLASLLVKKTPFRKLFALPSSGEIEKLLDVVFSVQWVQVIRGLASWTATVKSAYYMFFLSMEAKPASEMRKFIKNNFMKLWDIHVMSIHRFRSPHNGRPRAVGREEEEDMHVCFHPPLQRFLFSVPEYAGHVVRIDQRSWQ